MNRLGVYKALPQGIFFELIRSGEHPAPFGLNNHVEIFLIRDLDVRNTGIARVLLVQDPYIFRVKRSRNHCGSNPL